LNYGRNMGILPLFSIRFLRRHKNRMETSDPLPPAVFVAMLWASAVVGAITYAMLLHYEIDNSVRQLII